MKIEFDPRKDESNLAKHGISLALARSLPWDLAFIWEDRRFDYGEARYCAFIPFLERLFAATFTRRGDVFRVISLRSANERERRRYAEAIKDSIAPPATD